MKAVMISIRPEWCEKIISGEKTVEVRKTRPKIEPPYKCYIYCTRPKYDHEDHFVVNAGTENAFSFYGGGKVIGEFTCEVNCEISIEASDWDPIVPTSIPTIGMTDKQIADYLGNGKTGYAWFISDLVIYEKPLHFKDFYIERTMKCNSNSVQTFRNYLNRPPQSWCYVEELPPFEGEK